MNQRA